MGLNVPHTAPLPWLDLSRLDGPTTDHQNFLADLRKAAHDVGFFYLTGHGIAAKQCEEVLAVACRFFALPEAAKLEVEMIRSPHFRGYTRAGQELTRGRPDWREQFDINSERVPLWRPGAPAWMRLQGPNQWPRSLPELRPALLGWQAAMIKVAIRLLRALAETLGQSPDFFEPIYRDAPNQLIKIIRYPGSAPAADGQGVGAHKDSGFLTFVLQDTEGLEIEAQDGSWIKARPLQNSFAVNIGELLELATSGYLRATVHRVVLPPPGAERLSVAFFFGAQHDATVPLLTLPAALAADTRGVKSDPDNPLFQHVGTNYLKGRLRSHPHVAKRHYSDLIDAQVHFDTAV
jgi:isopenicillin N synthase-like dioxygenase